MGLPRALLLMLCLYPAPQGLAPPDPGLLAQGRARLREAQTLAQHPQLGACWAGALGRLDGGCQQLGEEQQSRIALAFAHCHLQRSGRPFPRCEAGSSVRACTQHMDPVAFGVYTEFFTHAHSICYLLRSEAWQQQAESTVHRLVASSESVAERLEETNQLAEQSARAQEATLRSQEEILRHGELLRQTLQDSSRGNPSPWKPRCLGSLPSSGRGVGSSD
nr:protein brambleberry-like [Caretta caretta]